MSRPIQSAQNSIQAQPTTKSNDRPRPSNAEAMTVLPDDHMGGKDPGWATRMRSLVGQRIRTRIHRSPTFSFLIPFFVLNCLLFLPLFLLNIEETRVLPGTADELRQVLPDLFLSRENYDIFRLNLEFLILVTVWATVRQLRRPAFRALLIAIYFVALAYAVYEGITLSIWQADPVFYTHYFMAVDGLQFLVSHLNLPRYLYLLAIILLSAAIGGIYPVFDYTSYPGVQRAAPVYGVSPEELETQQARFNPVKQIDRLVDHEIPVYLIHGKDDKVVPLDRNSEAVESFYRDAGSSDLITVEKIDGQGHNFWQGFFRCEGLIEFLIAAAKGESTTQSD